MSRYPLNLLQAFSIRMPRFDLVVTTLQSDSVLPGSVEHLACMSGSSPDAVLRMIQRCAPGSVLSDIVMRTSDGVQIDSENLPGPLSTYCCSTEATR